MRFLWSVVAFALAAPALAQAQESQTRFAGAPRIGSSDGWSIKPRGRAQYDIGDIAAPVGVAATGLGSVAGLRRIRLGVEGTAPGGITYVFEGDFAGGTYEITDAAISWRASRRLTLTAGQHNNFQSLEEVTSSRFTTFLERAAFTDAFGFERRLGLSGTLTSGPLTAQLGVFHDNLLDVDEGDGMVGVDGRMVYAPRLGDAQLHLAASAHWRDNGDLLARGTTSRYRQRPAIGITDTRFIATPALAIDGETSFGLEAAVIRGPFHAVAEAHWLTADRIGAADPTFFGFYAEVGWFLTGETRGYRGARWDRTRVRRGGAIEEGGLGAVQVNLRYDHLDLVSAGVRGGTQNALLASLIWIPTDQVRLHANLAHLAYREAVIPAAGGRRDYNVDTIGFRAEFDF